jgi:hypothetical protein
MINNGLVISKESSTEKSLCIIETDFSPTKVGFEMTILNVCVGSGNL